MKRRLMALILTLALMLGLSTAAGALVDRKERAAEALNRIDLFHGRSALAKDYDLGSGLNRAEGTILLLRLIGEEERANRYGPEDNVFEDMKKNRLSWALPGVAYAHKHGLVKGISETEFNPDGAMSDYMFLTLVLRQLGYKDGNDPLEPGIDFLWNKPYTLAWKVGLIDKLDPDSQFSRGDAVLIAWKALSAEYKDSKVTLADHLIEECIISSGEYRDAREIYVYGNAIADYSGDVFEDGDWAPEPGVKVEASAPVSVNRDGTTRKVVELEGREVSAFVPVGVTLEYGVDELELIASPMDEPGANLVVRGDEKVEFFDVRVIGVDSGNEVPVTVDLGPILEVGMDESFVELYHMQQGELLLMYEEFDLECLDEHDEFFYDPETGHLYVTMTVF